MDIILIDFLNTFLIDWKTVLLKRKKIGSFICSAAPLLKYKFFWLGVDSCTKLINLFEIFTKIWHNTKSTTKITEMWKFAEMLRLTLLNYLILPI